MRLSDAAKKEILANAENAIKNTVSQELTAVKTQTNFEVPEGTDMSDPEALLEVEMDPTTAAELESAIASDAAEVAIDTTKLAVEDKGKLSDTLSDEQKGEFAKKNEAAASSVTNTVSAGATSLSPAEKTALKEKAKQIKAKSLRSFFLTLGFPVVLADNAGQHHVALPANATAVEDTDLPERPHGDRSIRHFLVKGDNTSVTPTGWRRSLPTQVDVLLDNDYITDNVTNEAQPISILK